MIDRQSSGILPDKPDVVPVGVSAVAPLIIHHILSTHRHPEAEGRRIYVQIPITEILRSGHAQRASDGSAQDDDSWVFPMKYEDVTNAQVAPPKPPIRKNRKMWRANL